MLIIQLFQPFAWRRALFGLFVGLALAACQNERASADAAEIAVGMTFAEVEARLGPPERKGVLDGKDIEEIADVAAADAAGKRTVYIYEEKRLRVWFKDGRVTSITPAAAGPEEDAADIDH